MSKRTLFLIFSLFIITSVLLVLALYAPSNPKPVQIVTPPKEPIEQTVLSFGAPVVATSSSATNVNYSVPVNIETGKNKVTAIQLELQFDPKVLTNVVITPGSFFKNPTELLNQIDTKTGRISYAVGVGLTDQGVMGKGVVVTITSGAKAESDSAKAGLPQQTSIIFLPKTLVTAEGTTASVLKQTNNIQIFVGEKSSSPSAQ